MTRKEFLEMVIKNDGINEEMIAYASSELEKMTVANSKKNQEARKKVAAENAPLIASATELLQDGTPRMASEIGVALDITTSKATSIAKSIEGVIVGEVKVKGGRTVKTYSLQKMEP